MPRAQTSLPLLVLGSAVVAAACGERAELITNTTPEVEVEENHPGPSTGGQGPTITPDGGATVAQGGEGSEQVPGGCGDGIVQPTLGEVCDDANSTSGDGCAADCTTLEQDYACPVPGVPCVTTVVCGDSKISGAEQCDDGNTDPTDGCASTCILEAGWACPEPGKRCVAAACGDGILAGKEECDDGISPPSSGDGCSSICKVESGWACDQPNSACHQTVCNDGILEGDEPCDDGNNVIGDGCNPYCQVEPDCSAGECHSACGDGLILPDDNEECDDGNTLDGDGCSSLCKFELGFACDETLTDLPTTLEVPATFRDFIALPTGGATRHPDFEIFEGKKQTPGMVESNLGADGKPVYTGICEVGNAPGPCPYGNQTTGKVAFDQWYRDVPSVNVTKISKLSLNQQADGTYYFPDATFFPLTNAGFVPLGLESQLSGNNFGFTSEVRYWFEYKGNEFLQFSGDDDVWVFVGGRLVVDLGGLHPKISGSVTLNSALANSIGLQVGSVYEMALFHAERHTAASNFNLTLGGFVSAHSTCVSECGDGIVVGDELCDDGTNDGSWGTCNPDCTPGPYCGDAVVDLSHEDCDDGTNLTNYSLTGMPGCAPGCKFGAYCGDAQIDSVFGEQCDNGASGNDGAYGGCDPDCTLAARCGDHILQAQHGEQCDDGNTLSGDGCSSTCQSEVQ